ncbi:hypothetical protein [Edaphobacter albus]|uniref:hypothetical protein n=1 Tax=Edaphobacter sp. 4G125 TaxID=2763071 RepID=UPI00164730AB|nr:hypothetical protein [Edaphobacter sp. 4G125]QNI35747.1 hypothetical protein H7846_11955 [Edaphobacter sp. 4G125]
MRAPHLLLFAPVIVSLSLVAIPVAAQRLTDNRIILSPLADAHERLAAQVLSEEVSKRTHIAWPISSEVANTNSLHVIVTTKSHLAGILAAGHLAMPHVPMTAKPEGFSIRVLGKDKRFVVIAGNDARGVLFGVGYFLRHLDMKPQAVSLENLFDTDQEPEYSVRGHQLGYRPKNNTYDGWNVQAFDQYIRDLILFGTNTIELIPPHSDDAAMSPLFPEPPMEMMVKLSALINHYGISCSIWFPAMEKDYSDPAQLERSIHEWSSVFSSLPQVDAIFVPGGDPGHTAPKVLFHFLERVGVELHKYHPHAEMWVSPQAFSEEWLTQFYSLLRDRPSWLTGVVYGSEMRPTPAEFRAQVPSFIPIRFYPDIAHTASSEQPVPNWDPAFALTEGREPINPRPVDEGLIFHSDLKTSIGFVTYSEGVNDDINKFLWSGWGWDSKQTADDILAQYIRLFLAPALPDELLAPIHGLEENWRGSARNNPSIEPSLAAFQVLASKYPGLKTNWRFQQLLYRAYYDTYVQHRLRSESSAQEEAIQILRSAYPSNTNENIAAAEAAIETPPQCSVSNLCQQIQKLADDLFTSIHMQLTVTRHHASSVDRGANADSVDEPITDRLWILGKLKNAEVISGADRTAAIKEILDTVAPTSTLYDDVGQPGHQAHILPQPPALDSPVLNERIYSGVIKSLQSDQVLPISKRTYLGSLYDAPMKMKYHTLKKSTNYLFHVTYAKDITDLKLTVNHIPVKGTCHVSSDGCLEMTYSIPANLTSLGELEFEWRLPEGRGGHGRALQITTTELVEDPQ